MTVHEAPLDPIVQCHLVCEAWIAGNAPSGTLPSSAELLTQLSPTGRIRADVTFLDALPRNATGKILERMLIQPG